MTVKELKEILDACNDDAVVLVEHGDGLINVQDSQVFQTIDGTNRVVIDLTYGEER